MNHTAYSLFLVLLLAGCSQKQPSGIYEQDFSSQAPGPSGTPNAQAGFRMFTERARKTHRITFDGEHLDLLMGEQFHLSGTFKVSGRKLFLTPDRIESQPLGVAITNAATPNRSGRKFAYEMYMPDDDTIMFMGTTFRRSKH